MWHFAFPWLSIEMLLLNACIHLITWIITVFTNSLLCHMSLCFLLIWAPKLGIESSNKSGIRVDSDIAAYYITLTVYTHMFLRMAMGLSTLRTVYSIFRLLRHFISSYILLVYLNKLIWTNWCILYVRNVRNTSIRL